ncbi:abortive infection protein [Paenibacillus pectinilyticus]|uniref:Abortive infection protein n=1 Tax=Paenibacillus pectinilyticus TaxID=512399 RepID=A0A1C1A0N9_9BACL|nr:type II CAAX endopeptidase family protein [Paenibacillus pectinilyticus]OCT13980.1 abortive infection protein [Paenibacillus pectinilyticus]
MNVTLLRNLACLLLVGLLVSSLQTQNYLLLSLWGVCTGLLFIYKPMRSFLLTTIGLGVGFASYLFINANWIHDVEPKEWQILLNRLSLICMIIPLLILALMQKVPFMRYAKAPHWNERMGIPLIWSGFRQSKVKYFLLIAMAAITLAFMPFVIRNGWHNVQEIWLFAIAFSITNVLEEIIWRGILLSRFSEQLGDKGAVFVTSVGFGLQHYSLGFSWGVCIAYAIGGLYFGGITIKSRSIVPVLIWHSWINVLMIFSGFLL